jgi:hypothetical protein
MAELTRRAAARTWVRRRMALVRQADILGFAASGPARSRGIVGAADQAVITGAIRPAVTGAPLARASLEIALVRPHAAARSAGETRVVGAARQPVIAVTLDPAVAAAATARARSRWSRCRSQRIAADRGRGAGSWSSGRPVRVIRAAKERRITTGVLRPSRAIAADTRSRWIGADLLCSRRGVSRLQPQHREDACCDTGAASPQGDAT